MDRMEADIRVSSYIYPFTAIRNFAGMNYGVKDFEV